MVSIGQPLFNSNLFAMTLDPTQALSQPSEMLADAQMPPSSNGEKTPQKNHWPMFNPNSVKNSNELWVNAEMLFWQSNLGSSSYGTTSNSTTTISDGRVKNLHFDWEFGFRLGLGYKLPHDKWDLLVNYTYMHGNAHGHAGGSGDVVFPNWATNFGTPTITPFYADTASAHWRMNLNMGDVELGRTCWAGKWLTIRPFVGIRGLVINQNFHVNYMGGTVAPGDTDQVRTDNDFWGVGLRMGANTLWGLGAGISIYGNGSFSLLSGEFDVNEYERHQATDLTLMNVSRDIDSVVVTADLALGLQWDYMFSKDRYHFGLKFGWEFDMFFDQNQLFNFIGSNPGAFQTFSDDLSFQGITLGMRFDF
jgi:hypothetical protein